MNAVANAVPATMRAVVVTEFGRAAELRDVPTPSPAPDGVLVKVQSTGLCRSDVGGWLGHDDGIALPHVPGHEFVGVIVATGDLVQRVSVGQRVTVPFVCACGMCPECDSGNAQVCRNQTQPGFTHWGSYAEYVAVRHADLNLIVVDADVHGDAATLLGCRFATAYRGLLLQAGCGPSDRVLVAGCGGVGLSAVMIARSAGAEVMALDIDEAALTRAREQGARWTLNTRDRTEQEVLAEIAAHVPGGITLSVDALGRESTVCVCIRSLSRRGRHVQIGLVNEPPRFPLAEVIARELAVFGSHGMSAADYPLLVDAVRSGALRPADIVTTRIGLPEVPSALAAVASGDWNGGVTIIDV